MPYITETREVTPELVMNRKGVSIYRTYKDDDVEQGASRNHFVCAPANSDHASSFDIRDLPYPPNGPTLNDHPSFLDTAARDRLGFENSDEWTQSDIYKNLKLQWEVWHETGQPESLENHLIYLIDEGHFDQWREKDEIEYSVQMFVTVRAVAETKILAANDEVAENMARGMKWNDPCFSPFSINDMSPEGDEIAYVRDADYQNNDDPIEIDMREPYEPFSWGAVDLVKRIARLTTPEDEFNSPDLDHQDNYDSVEEFVADLSDESLMGEYDALMNLVREARSLLKTPAA